MFNYKIILPLFLLSINSLSYANCINAQKDEYSVLNYSIALEQKELTNNLLSKYCFDFNNYYRVNSNIKNIPGIFYAKSIDDLNIYTQRGYSLDSFKKGKFQIDLLSSLLLQENMQITLSESEKNEVLKLENKYDKNLKTIKVNPLKIEDSEKILNFVADKYNKNYSLPINFQNNTPVSFAILANEPKILNKLLYNSNRSVYLYKKNDHGITPIHLAFSKKYPLDKINYKKNINEINDILIKNIESSKIIFLKIDNLTFFEVAELFKDVNPDFYQKLKNKFHFNVSIEKFKNLKELKSNMGKQIDFVAPILSYEKN